MGFRAPLAIEGYAARVGMDPTTGRVRSAPLPPVEEREPVSREAPVEPRLRGLYGFTEATSCTVLVAPPEVIWDVNYYYRVHGFTWPFRGITVRALMEAHHARGGIDDPYMTLGLKTLRDPAQRWVYDRQPLGEPVIDSYFKAFLKAKAIRKSAYLREHLGVDMNPEKILESLGFGLDGVAAGQEASSTPPERVSEGPATVSPPWSWGFYQLGTTCDDTDLLGRWQEMLVRALNRVGMTRRFCVGVMGRQPASWHSREVHNRLVIFIHEDAEPTDELAAQAVTAL